MITLVFIKRGSVKDGLESQTSARKLPPRRNCEGLNEKILTLFPVLTQVRGRKAIASSHRHQQFTALASRPPSQKGSIAAFPVRAAEMVKTNVQWRRRNLIQEREQEKRLTKKEAKINLNFKFILFEVSVGLSNIQEVENSTVIIMKGRQVRNSRN